MMSSAVGSVWELKYPDVLDLSVQMEHFSLKSSLCAAKDFVVFVVPLLEARLLYHIICHLTMFSGTSNKHRHKCVDSV